MREVAVFVGERNGGVGKTGVALELSKTFKRVASSGTTSRKAAKGLREKAA